MAGTGDFPLISSMVSSTQALRKGTSDGSGVTPVVFSDFFFDSGVVDYTHVPSGGSVSGGTGCVSYVDPLSTNTKLVLRGEGGTIVDDKGHTAVLAGGTAVPSISTTQHLFGESSIHFPSGSNMYFADDPDWTIGNNNYTIDFWIYSTASADGCILYQGDEYGSPHLISNIVFLVEGGKILWMPDYQNFGSHLQLYSTTLMGTTWNHVALVRDGDTFTLYINGVQEATQTKTVTIQDSSYPLHMGSMGVGGWPDDFYLDSFRFNNGDARWTAPFTPPLAYEPLISVTHTPSGGTVSGGTSPNDWSEGGTEITHVPDGGVVGGGTSPFGISYLATPSGGAVSGGSATVSRVYVNTPSGGAVTGGAATVTRSLTSVPAGGAVSGGTATQTLSFAHVPSGGAVTGGAADISSETASLDYYHTAEGGATAGGASPYSATLDITGGMPNIGGVSGGGSGGGVWWDDPRYKRMASNYDNIDRENVELRRKLKIMQDDMDAVLAIKTFLEAA